MKFHQSLPPRLQAWLPYLLLIGAVLTAYCNVYDNEFLFDDGLIITLNTLLHSWSTFGDLFTASTTEGAHIGGGFYRPVQLILYFFTYQIAGDSTFAFHLLNISLHAANACLVFALGRKLGFNLWATLLAALIWALHPIHTEAVTYMSATADTLYSFFCLAGIVFLLPDFSPKRILWVLPLFLLGLLSKETAVVFPLLAAVTLYDVSPQRLKWKTYLPLWPLFAIAAAYSLWRLTSTAFDGPATYAHIFDAPEFASMKMYAGNFDIRLDTFFATLPAYLELLLWPHGLHMERTFSIYADFWLPPVMLGAALVALALYIVFLVKDKRVKPLGWGILWFGAAHAPDSGLFMATNSLFLEHWMYLPSAGLFLGLAETLNNYLPQTKNRRERYAAAGIALAVSIMFGALTLAQNATWRDPVTFYNHLFDYGVVSARAHNNLALAYVERKDYPAAIAEFKKAIKISDIYPETWHNMALSVLDLPDRKDHIPEAIDDLNHALKINPNFYRSYLALAGIYQELGDKEKAEAYVRQAQDILAQDKFIP